jgi:hypothetical protein
VLQTIILVPFVTIVLLISGSVASPFLLSYCNAVHVVGDLCWLAGTLQEPAYNGPPAKEYPFELDTFQKTSVACLVSMQFLPRV